MTLDNWTMMFLMCFFFAVNGVLPGIDKNKIRLDNEQENDVTNHFNPF